MYLESLMLSIPDILAGLAEGGGAMVSVLKYFLVDSDQLSVSQHWSQLGVSASLTDSFLQQLSSQHSFRCQTENILKQFDASIQSHCASQSLFNR